MRAADILAHPSWYEAAPRVVLEAMASGLAVVATRIPGTEEVLGSCGRFVDIRDANSLAPELSAMARDPEARAELAGRARDRFVERFRVEGQLHRIHELYDRLTDDGWRWSEAS